MSNQAIYVGHHEHDMRRGVKVEHIPSISREFI